MKVTFPRQAAHDEQSLVPPKLSLTEDHHLVQSSAEGALEQ